MCEGLSVLFYHEVKVESFSTMSKVPETLQPSSRNHHREVVLVGAPEQLLVRYVGVGAGHGPAMNGTPKHKKQAENPGQHVWINWRLLL